MNQTSGKNILVIDDNKPILEFFRLRLKNLEQFNFFPAASLSKTKELIIQNKFFAAIVDLELPDAKSGEALDFVLSKGIPSIVITASVDDKLREEIVKKPIVDYIQKDSLDSLEYAVKMLSKLAYFESKKVLIVDDSRSSCAYIAEQFERLLFQPIWCTNPLEAVEILQANKDIKLVTIDYEMPGINGIDLIKKIRKTLVGRELLIFGISGSNSEKVKYQFLKNGATSYFIKPIIREEFVSKIINHMQRVEQQENLESYIDKVDKYVITSITDRDGVIKQVSQAFCDISGYSKSELIGRPHGSLLHPDMDKKIYNDLWTTVTSGKNWNGELKNSKKDGGYYWVNAHVEPIFDGCGAITGFQTIRMDITDKKQIEMMSITDELTGLYNRRYFNSQILQRLEQAKQEHGGFAFFMMDIDNFKKYNDTYGHKMGDDVLTTVGKLLKEMFSMDGDIVFRLGGEEFGGIVAAENEADFVGSINAFRESLEGLRIEHGKNNASPFVTASFGGIFVDFADNGNSNINAEKIYIAADEALYKAKENGRNRIELGGVAF